MFLNLSFDTNDIQVNLRIINWIPNKEAVLQTGSNKFKEEYFNEINDFGITFILTIW